MRKRMNIIDEPFRDGKHTIALNMLSIYHWYRGNICLRVFQIILKRPLQNDLKILKKCFLFIDNRVKNK